MKTTPIRLLRFLSHSALAAVVFLLASCGGDPADDGPGDQTAAAGEGDSGTADSNTADDPSGDQESGDQESSEASTDTGTEDAPVGEVEITVLKEGQGDVLGENQVALVEYSGYLYPGGQEFDSSRKGGREPFRVDMSNPNVIQGWVDGLKGMKVGEERKLLIPPSLGYGSSGSGAKIPPDSTLMFYVELVGVEDPPSGGKGSSGGG